jgi:transcription-repair coupling factor (superfamily II helicase)
MLGFMQQHGLKPQTVAGWQAFLSSDAPLCLTVTPLAYGFQLADAALSPADGKEASLRQPIRQSAISP